MSAQRVAVTTGAPAATAFSPTLPTHAADDRMVLVVTGKYNTASIPTINQGWTIVQSGTGGTGTTGNDAGQVFWAVYAKDATSGSETAPTVTPGGTAPNSWEWMCFTYRHDAGEVWRDAIANGAAWVTAASDTNTASPLTGTAGAWTGVEPTDGDAILAAGVVPTDLGSALGATTLTCTGLSGGTQDTTSTNYRENSLGQDSAAVWADWVDFTGTASAGLAISFTVTGASNQSGVVIAIALRVTAADPNAPVLVATSRSGASDTNASSNTCPVPAGAAAGMVAILAIEIFLDGGSAPVSPTWPTGFTQIVDERANPSSGVQLLIAKKALTGADSGNYVTALGATRWNQSDCALVSGAGGLTVLDPVAGTSTGTGSGTSIASLSLTASAASVLIHFQANSSSGTHTPPTGYAEQQEGDYITVATRAETSGDTYATTGASQSVSTPWAAALIGVEGDSGTPTGGGTGSVSTAGTADGSTAKSGSGTGSVSMAGTASGSTAKSGAGTGAVSISGTANGGAPPNAGSGTGSVTASGTATGSTVTSGSGTGAVTTSGTAAGSTAKSGAGTGAVSVTGTATGSKAVSGSGTGAVSVSGTAAGTAPMSGSGTGSVSTSGTADGVAPAIGVPSGSGVGAVTVSGTASGTSERSGSGDGTVAVTGTATGSKASSGSGTGTVAVSGTADGTAPTIGETSGSGSGSVVASGSASGSTDRSGSGAGSITVDGSSIGTTVKGGGGVGLVEISGFASSAVMGTPALNPGVTVHSQVGRALTARSTGQARVRSYAGRVKVGEGTAEQ